MNRWAAVGWVILGCLGAFVISEMTLRAIGYSSPLLYQGDPYTGASLRPGAKGWWTKEGRAYVVINSDGLRDREHSIQKPTGVWRIAVLGDSYPEALQLPMEQAFWAVMERELNTRCDALKRKRLTAEVINFGVSGYGTARELITLRHKVWKYDPDLVLLAFLTGNDVRDNSRALNQEPMIPYFILKDGRLVLDDSFLRRPQYRSLTNWKGKVVCFLNDHFYTFQFLNDVRHRLQIYWKNAKPGDLAEAGLDNQVYLPPKNQAWREAWAVTEALVVQMAREVQKHGAKFLLATLSNGFQVLPSRERREAFKRKYGIQDLLYPDKRIASLADRYGIPFVMLAPVLRRWAEEHGQCVHGYPNATPCHGHWNAYGHRVAGITLAREICEMVAGESKKLGETQ
ncbi:SGNH/GDSL hydrolase family protein [Candidatus Parcubacteria bacterium]|nr:MAG: SGNH/GDSL hydrolase family protein [Candidatus Parcubacteria bacterium]